MESTDDSRAVPEIPDEELATISAHRSSPDRLVFSEEDNNDGWISTAVSESTRSPHRCTQAPAGVDLAAFAAVTIASATDTGRAPDSTA